MREEAHKIERMQSLERPLPGRRLSRRARRLLHSIRRAAIGATALASLPPLFAALRPGAPRAELLLTAALLAVTSFFLYREYRRAVASLMAQRFIWHRLRDVTQIFEVVLGMRSEKDVRSLSSLALQEATLLLGLSRGALLLHAGKDEDPLTMHGLEGGRLRHLPWITELEGLMEGAAVGAAIFVPDLAADPHFGASAVLRRSGLRSFAAAKLGIGEKSLGLLVVGDTEPHEFRHGDDKTLELTARQIAVSVQHGVFLNSLFEKMEELKRSNDGLTYSNQLQQEFASVASHELKTPLTAIKAYTDNLLADTAEGETANLEDFLLVIREEADRLIDMTDKILEISGMDYRGRAMERQALRVERVCAACARALEVHLQEKDMQLAIDIPAALPPVFADPHMIRQAMINLIGNAIKYSAGGTQVSIEAAQDDEWVELSVRDQGIGIPPDEIPHIFERFFQGRQEGDDTHKASTGLGLAIVWEIIEQHDGEIRVDSRAGEGSVFTIRLPRAPLFVGLEGSPLAVLGQPSEVEEFLRLGEQWLRRICAASEARFFLAIEGQVRPLDHCESLDNLTAAAERSVRTGLSQRNAAKEESLLSVPLNFQGHCVGAFTARRSSALFSEEDRLLAEGAIERIMRVLDFAAAEQDTGRVLRRAMRAVRDLTKTSGAGSPYRADLVQAVADLARGLGCDAGFAGQMRLAATFHDLGMLQVRAGIESEGRELHPDEKERIRAHPQVAARLLADLKGMEDVGRIVLHHHERFDGGGYPAGLAGEEIPLGARILSVADAFFSMTSPRRYRPMRSQERAMDELRRCSGSQFDPVVVKAFLKVLIGNEGGGQRQKDEHESEFHPSEPRRRADNQSEAVSDKDSRGESSDSGRRIGLKDRP